MQDVKDIQIADLLNRIAILTREASELRANNQILLVEYNKEKQLNEKLKNDDLEQA